MSTNKSLAVRAGNLRRWAKEPDPAAALAPARAGLRGKFVREVEALGITDPAEIERRADQLHRAFMTEMARKSAAARRKPAPRRAA